MHHHAAPPISAPSLAARSRLVPAALVLVLTAASAARADKVDLVDGDVLTGKVVEQSDGTVVLDHPVLGRLEIPADKVKAVHVEPPAVSEAAIEAAADADAAQPISEEPEKPKEWKFSLDLSLNTSSGNTVEDSFRFGWLAVREREDTRLTIDGAYYLKRTDYQVTDNKLTTGVRHDWLMPESPWFWFASGRYDYDQFQSWQQRIAAHAGPGYHLVDKENLKVDLLAGLGMRKEVGSDNDDLKFEGSFGTELAWKITERQSFDFSMYYYPVLTDIDDYRTRTTANWRYAFGDGANLSLLAGLVDEYQGIVDPGKKRNDLRVFAGIQYSF